jgi:hypothetical protein
MSVEAVLRRRQGCSAKGDYLFGKVENYGEASPSHFWKDLARSGDLQLAQAFFKQRPMSYNFLKDVVRQRGYPTMLTTC